MRQWMVLAGACALAGCQTVAWVKPGATPMEFEQTKLQCQYQAELATAAIPTGVGLGGAMASGMEKGIKQAQLMTLCLETQGWHREAVASN